MNPDEFRNRIQQLAEVTWRLPDQPAIQGTRYRLNNDTGPGATIDELRLNPVKCEDCGIICTQQPRRSFVKKTRGWLEKCQECGLWRNDSDSFGALAYKKSGTVPKRNIDLRTTQLNSTTHQSQPIEHDANDSRRVPVDILDPDQDSESDP